MRGEVSGDLLLIGEVTDVHGTKVKVKVYSQANELGIDIADAAAVGDTYNDIPMLERVGHSFIVDNAEEHMNAHAKWRIPSNNDGGVLTLIDAILAAR